MDQSNIKTESIIKEEWQSCLQNGGSVEIAFILSIIRKFNEKYSKDGHSWESGCRRCNCFLFAIFLVEEFNKIEQKNQQNM